MSFLRRTVFNPVAANMLMLLILGGGWFAARHIPRELFPEFALNQIVITVPYPQASPADVDESICKRIEDKLEGLAGVSEIKTTSREGLATVIVELLEHADSDKLLNDVKSRVDNVKLPGGAEDPVTAEFTRRFQVIQVAVVWDVDPQAGPHVDPEATLKELAEDIREDLADLPELSQVTVSGVRDYEIAVEVSEQSLRRHELTVEQVARAISEGSFDLPAGTVKTKGGELTIRVVGQHYTAEGFARIPVLSRPDGTIIRLADIATVTETFEDMDIGGQFNGKPAALVTVFKTGDEDTIEIVEAVKRYIDEKRVELPKGILLETWSDMSKLVSDRLNMLIRNGTQGLVLVFCVLWLFLGFRMSIWVAVGIPVSIMGTMLVLDMSGMTLNMMSMFALIMTLGLIVDDAIIVGENVYSHVQRGMPPRLAAVEGTKAVLLPVIGAVATTWLAFVPLLFIPGIMGRFIIILPITIIVALGFSLIECLIILPPHLAHSLRPRATQRDGWAMSVRHKLDDALATFLDKVFIPVFRRATRYRYVTVSIFLAVMIVIVGAFKGNRIKVVGMPHFESDTLVATLILPTGTPMLRTTDVARRIAQAARGMNAEFTDEVGQPMEVAQRVYSLLGQQAFAEDGQAGSHVAEVIVELMPAEQRGRDIASGDLVARWREATGLVPDALSLTFRALRGGAAATPLEMRILGDSNEALEPVAERIKQRLATYPGVSDIEDDALPGNMEMQIALKSGAPTLGITLETIASQLRGAFYGSESYSIQRGRDELKVMVRYPPGERRSLSDVENMRVRTAGGDEVPFYEVADVTLRRGYTTLRRAGRKNVITVSADVDSDIANAEEILKDLKESGFFVELAAEFPDVKVDLRGQRQQLFESFNSLKIWYPIALLGIYTILAAIFKSYVQPIIVMIAIPFGLMGAVIGHMVLGFDVTLLSMFGIVALTGIVVNDSLVLIDLINRRVRAGDSIAASAETGARDRFRPILLTTATTVVGIGPLLLERSFQAQFLKPMVVSIAFGLSFATMLTLLAVPSLYLIGNDIRRVGRWLIRGQWPSAEDVARREPPEEILDQ